MWVGIAHNPEPGFFIGIALALFDGDPFHSGFFLAAGGIHQAQAAWIEVRAEARQGFAVIRLAAAGQFLPFTAAP
jgi:hypothetical protein